MALSDHQRKHNRNPSQRKNGIIKLNTNDVIHAKNMLLTQTVDEMTKQLPKLPQ